MLGIAVGCDDEVVCFGQVELKEFFTYTSVCAGDQNDGGCHCVFVAGFMKLLSKQMGYGGKRKCGEEFEVEQEILYLKRVDWNGTRLM
jgi:hypothetical protein